ncbi:MAG: helix-turn-helix transcriptional regulator [Spirochaetales bacterium]|nr:helix-turn-helix transcriptional regulator [Spirochaetales bacterium]
MIREKGRFFIILFLLLPLFLFIPLILVSFKKPVILFPSTKTGIKDTIWTYNNSEESRILRFDVNEKHINFQFVHESIESFAGIGINLSEYPAFFDISPFSSIHLTLATEAIRTCTITLKLFVHGITDMNNDASYRHFSINFPIKAEKNDYVLPISRFKDASWWIRDYNPRRKKIGKESLENACFLLIDSSPGDEKAGILNTKGSITVYHISFHKSHFIFYMLSALAAGGYYFLIFIFLFIWKRKYRAGESKQKRIIEHKKLMVENYRDTDLKKIITCLETKYMDPEISLGKVSNECGLSPTRISSLIKDEYNISFKQILNRIRLTEAKRLLKETDRQVIDIAFSLGYNDRSYFYKVFLKNEGISPRDFRKKHT